LSDDSVKKTLTLKPQAPAKRGARRDDPPSARSGSRARRVAQSEIEGSKAKAPTRSGAPRPASGDSRPPREGGDRPRGDRPSFAGKSAGAGARPPRPAGDRPDRGPRPEGSARPDRGPRPEGSARPDRGPRPDAPARSPRPTYTPRSTEAGERPARPAAAAPQYEDPTESPHAAARTLPPRSDAPRGDARGERPRSERPQADRSHGDRPRGDRPQGDRPGANAPRTDRPRTDRPRDMALRSAARAAALAEQPAADGNAAAADEVIDARGSAPARSTGDHRPPRRPYDKPAGSPARSTVDGHTSGAEIFQVFAPCPQGLDDALAAELVELGFTDARAGRAGAHFSTDWTGVMRANLYSRLATRILAQVAQETVTTEDELYALAKATPWERWFGAEQTLRVDTSAVRSPMQSLQFCNLKAKDGICDRLREGEGERPSIDTVRPDARVHVFLSESTATLYLDTSGESLFKRGWRLDKGEAPLRENLAAGMLVLAGWDPATPLLDPFCGSGTLVIEAALKALRVPPGISRPFAFERLRGHQERRWHDLKEDARAKILKEIPATLAGADIDPRAIEAARMNAQRAGLAEDTVYFEVADARDTCPLDERAGTIITNPPYGERLEMEANDTLWSEWATTLKREFGGWKMHMITNDLDLPKKLRLNPSRRTPLYNGALECRLFSFDLVSGGFRDK
jgi:putative N6-adenine-specific DNA methylase